MTTVPGKQLVRLRDLHQRLPVRLVPVTELVTTREAMERVLGTETPSDTPYAPIELYPRSDRLGWDIGDGHHRVASELRAGHTVVVASIAAQPDEEEYDPPFYDFTRPVQP